MADGVGHEASTRARCPQNSSDYLLAHGRPGDVAVVETARSYTYEELRDAAGMLAASLVGAGVAPGARIAVVGPNSFFWTAAYLAAMKLGVAVPLSDKLLPDDMARQAARVDCSAVLMDRRHVRRFAGSLPHDVPVLTDESLTADEAPFWPDHDVDPDTDATLMFTSGTTSEAKAVRVTHRNIQANTESIITYLELTRDDRMLVVLPFFYCFGASLLHTHLRAGGSLALCNSFAFPETALDMLDRERCTGLAGVPSSFQMLLRTSSLASRELPSLRLIQQAGGKLPPVLIEELVAAKPRAKLFVMYGQTEATARLSYLPPDLVLEKTGSIGRGIPGVTLQVVDDHGDLVPPGVTGEIVASGENVSPGYLDAPEESARKFPGDLLRTGDLAVVDADGYIFIVDRAGDFIKSWGYRISSQEVEACALRMADLVSAAAIGIPDVTAGEAVTLVATVRPGSSVTADDVIAFTRQNLAKHMVPQAVHLVDSLPLTSSGKVAKSALRDLISQTPPSSPSRTTV